MSSWNKRTRVLRLTREELAAVERRPLRYPERVQIGGLLARFILADIVVCAGRVVKSRDGRVGPVPKGHGDIRIAITRQAGGTPSAAVSSAIRRERRRRRAHSTTKGTT